MSEHVADSDPDRMGRETILILGASSDIGLEVIRQVAAGDALILAHYNTCAHKLERLHEELPDKTIVPIQADFTREDDVRRVIALIRDRYPSPDKIVHLPAPKLEYIRFKDHSWDNFQRDLDIQLRSIFIVLQAFLPSMGQRKKGKIVFVLSSVVLNIPPAALSHYVTAKYALWGLAKSLAAEYSSKRVNINAVSPSMVETAFLEKLPERMVEIAGLQSPWQRNATPKDVAGVVRFLLSSEADYLTGANIPVTGGSAF